MTPQKLGSRNKAVEAIEQSIRHHLTYSLGKRWGKATPQDLLKAVGYAARDRIIDRMLTTESRFEKAASRRVHFLSMEYLIGRVLRAHLTNLGVFELFEEALKNLHLSFEKLEDQEHDAALGNGGVGRLAACFMDSMATLGIPATSYGINYEFGLFKQYIEGDQQRELPDVWFQEENPWLIERPEDRCVVPLYGQIEATTSLSGNLQMLWLNWQSVSGVPYDLPVAGYGSNTVNTLRLFSARASQTIEYQSLQDYDYIRTVEKKLEAQNISKTLYPSGAANIAGESRLIQEYFLASCSIQDIFRQHLKQHGIIDSFAEKNVIHINDTHPTFAIPEMMRLLLDEHGYDWERAWSLVQQSVVYTVHTLMSGAFQQWPVEAMRLVLPRHLQIIEEINRRFVSDVAARWPNDSGRKGKMAIIDAQKPERVRMAHLAMAGARSINGVSAVHGDLLKVELARDFCELWPERFGYITNGVTQRRWLLQANSELADLLTQKIGCGWVSHLEMLKGLEQCAEDVAFRTEFRRIKQENKQNLSKWVRQQSGVALDVDSIYDVQIKRIHEYKRQLLNVLHIIALYMRVADDRVKLEVPRTFIFAGKAAPGNKMAKLIIRLIHQVSSVIQHDRRTRNVLRVIFLPDYNVSLAQKIIPAANLSEQISTAGMEASGTGNMKLALNGALTIATYDGSTIEMEQEIGAENMYLFGHRFDEIAQLNPVTTARHIYDTHAGIRRVIDALECGRFSPGDPMLFVPIVDLLKGEDPYFHLADFEAYWNIQQRVAHDFQDFQKWTRMAILNVARMGRFSSDRSVAEYARRVWKVKATVD